MEDIEDKTLSMEDVNELEERRLQSLEESGISEIDVIGKAKENVNIWQNYFNENITRGKDDLNFVLRDQWTAIERSEFTRLFKPAMTFNRLYDAVKKISGEQRKNKPDLLVRSLTGKATQEQIDLRADLVRTISYQSQNDLVYQTAFRSALMIGYGAFQINIDYESPTSFKQIITFDAINDPTKTSFDPSAIKPHKGDGNFCARQYLLSRKEFDATYPYINNPVSFADPRMLLDLQWETRDTIVLCDYFEKTWFPTVIYLLSNGQSVTKEEWERLQDLYKNQKKIIKDHLVEELIESEMPRIVSERQTQDYKIMHYRLTKDRIVDFSEWPSKYLPIIFVDGDSYYIEGRQYTKSFIHEARDAQKFINYVGSEIAAEIKNRRREQWIGTPDSVAGYEQEWKNPELQMGLLRARPDPKTGQMPTKMPAWELSQGLIQNFQRGVQDIREILGISETDQLQGRDISGTARRERKIESSMSSYVYFSNLNQAIEQAGRVVLDLLPVVYHEENRHVIVSKNDGSTKSFIINERTKDGLTKNELTKGDYDIEIDTGPSFSVQKEIALEFLQTTLQANPQVFNLVADLWAKNLDVQFMPQIAERLKSLVPQEIIAKEAGEPPPPPQPNPMMEMQQMQMQLAQQQLVERAEELKIRQEKHELEKAKLILDAKKLAEESESKVKTNHIALQKADLDYSAKIAKVLADLHK